MDRTRSTRESYLETLRTARICFLGAEARVPTEIWYVLHGYRQSARRFLTRFESIASSDRLLVAPEGLSRFYLTQPDGTHGPSEAVGASWMTRDDREAEVRDYIRYLNRVALFAEEGLEEIGRTVLGFSQGAHTATRWAVLGRMRIGRLILWGAGLPQDLPKDAATRLGGTRVVLVRGAEDPHRRSNDERSDEDWLRRNEIPFRVREHGRGHEIMREVLDELAAEDT